MSQHAHIQVPPRTVRPLGVRPQELLSRHPASIGIIPGDRSLRPFRPFRPTLPPAPKNPSISFTKIRKNPSKTHHRKPSSTLKFFLWPTRQPNQPPNHPATKNGNDASSLRGASWTAAGSTAPRRFRAGDGAHTFPARACGRKRRRRFAVPAQSKTRSGWPCASEFRGASRSAAVSRAAQDQPQRVGPQATLSISDTAVPTKTLRLVCDTAAVRARGVMHCGGKRRAATRPPRFPYYLLLPARICRVNPPPCWLKSHL
jgi:hypothetical protein